MSDKENRERRIGGKNWWLLHDMGEKIGEAGEAYQEWVRKTARKHDCYADQLENVLTGKVVSDDGKVSRLSDKFIDQSEIEFKKVDSVRKELVALKVKLAHEYKTFPDLIDVKTGKISDIAIDIVEPVVEETKGIEKPDKQESKQVETEPKE